ncbi:MAG TPA: PPOX class F420-dependent oxidoreductase [Acidimicrobiales bacterium]
MEYAAAITLENEKYIRFTSFRRDGTPVVTPTWVVPLDDGSYGFWTSSGSGKAKRLAQTSRVSVQPSDVRGNPKAGTTALNATARLVQGSELAEISQKIKAKYGFMTTMSHVFGVIGGIVKRHRIPYGDLGVVIILDA